MKWSVYTVFILAMILASSQSGAVELTVEQQVDQIREACAGDGDFAAAIAGCLEQKDHEIGQELEQIYKRLVKELPRLDVTTLRETQRAWLKYQDQICRARERRNRMEGPSFARSALASCSIETTLHRINELRLLRGDIR